MDELVKNTKSKNFVVLDSDSREPTKPDKFTKLFPELSYSFGISEQNMVSAAAGMATYGIIPFINSYAQFISMRSLDQVRNPIYPNLNVKICQPLWIRCGTRWGNTSNNRRYFNNKIYTKYDNTKPLMIYSAENGTVLSDDKVHIP